MDALKGYKTYIVAALAGVVTVLQMLGYVDGELAVTLYGFLGAGGLATLRAAVPK